MAHLSAANRLDWFQMSRVETAPEADTADAPPFRLDNEQLALRFTATLSDRYGTPVERLPTPGRLDDWLHANGLRAAPPAASPADLEQARALRESIHRIGTAIATGDNPEPQDVETLNLVARHEHGHLELRGTTAHWTTASDQPTVAALASIAQDAITALTGQRGTLKTCQNPACGGLFLDTSRAQARRWCSMNICGNRAKKARYRGTGS